MGTFLEELEKILGLKKANVTAFPTTAPDPSGGSSLEDIPYPDSPMTASPDASKDFLQSGGYQPPPTTDPYSLSDAEIFAITKDRPSPFTVIDIKTRFTSVQNFPINASTAKAIVNYLGAQSFSSNFFPIPNLDLTDMVIRSGITVELPGIGNYFRLERTPPGVNLPLYNSGPNLTRLKQGFLTPGIDPNPNSNVVFPQKAINNQPAQFAPYIYGQGVYVQFDSTDAPIFRAKPGESYTLPFSKIYITLFAQDLNYRAIIGQKAQVQGFSDDRVLRQNIAIGDAGGLLDGSAIRPIPFAISAAKNGGASVAIAANGTALSIFASNWDQGSSMSVIPGTGTVPAGMIGKTSNAGYAIMFITGLKLTINVPAGGFYNIALVKGRYKSGKNFASFPRILASDNFGFSSGVQTSIFNINIPIRVVLAGFDAQDAPPLSGAVGYSTETGEALGISVTNTNSFAGSVAFGYSVQGYVFGGINGFNLTTFADVFPDNGGVSVASNLFLGLFPFNPYVEDVDWNQGNGNFITVV